MGNVSIQYTTTADGVRLAWSCTGEGPPVILVPNFPLSHVSYVSGVLGEWFDTMASGCRLIWYDSRGCGLSQRDRTDFDLASLALDVAAIADAAGEPAPTLCSLGNGAPIAISFAASHPDSLARLILLDGWALGADNDEVSAHAAEEALRHLDWKTYSEAVAGVATDYRDRETIRRFAWYMRECVSQEANVAAESALCRWDATGDLAKLNLPTLLIHPSQPRWRPLGAAQRIAASITGARLELSDGVYSVEVAQRLLAFVGGRIEGPLANPGGIGLAPATALPRTATLQAILFTDLEGHTAMMSRLGDAKGREVLREHERLTRQSIEDHGGRAVKNLGDGFMASFASAQAALECAITLQRRVADGIAGERIRLRAGINAGEPISEDDDFFGSTVIAAARIAASADGGQVLVADVVRQLVAGKGFLLRDAGPHPLKGLNEKVRLWELLWQPGDLGAEPSPTS